MSQASVKSFINIELLFSTFGIVSSEVEFALPIQPTRVQNRLLVKSSQGTLTLILKEEVSVRLTSSSLLV